VPAFLREGADAASTDFKADITAPLRMPLSVREQRITFDRASLLGMASRIRIPPETCGTASDERGSPNPNPGRCMRTIFRHKRKNQEKNQSYFTAPNLNKWQRINPRSTAVFLWLCNDDEQETYHAGFGVSTPVLLVRCSF
jgi:hypothetical protein